MIVKQVGASGQLSLGKEYAGRTVIIENPEDGVWLIRTAQVIPDSELWLHEPSNLQKLEAGLQRAEANPAQPSDLDTFEKSIRERWEKLHGERLDE